MGKLAVAVVMSLAIALWKDVEMIEANDCTPPWIAETNPFYAKIKSETFYKCPPIFGDQTKEYCCYDSDGDVKCCNYKEYLIYCIMCSIPICIIAFIILLIVSSVLCCMCPCCITYKHRRI